MYLRQWERLHNNGAQLTSVTNRCWPATEEKRRWGEILLNCYEANTNTNTKKEEYCWAGRIIKYLFGCFGCRPCRSSIWLLVECISGLPGLKMTEEQQWDGGRTKNGESWPMASGWLNARYSAPSFRLFADPRLTAAPGWWFIGYLSGALLGFLLKGFWPCASMIVTQWQYFLLHPFNNSDQHNPLAGNLLGPLSMHVNLYFFGPFALVSFNRSSLHYDPPLMICGRLLFEFSLSPTL